MITESTLAKLREDIKEFINGKRLSHTYAVEEEIANLGLLLGFGSEDVLRLRAAALLHDVTKQLTKDEQIALCNEHSIPITDDETSSPKTLHAITGAFVAKQKFPEIADEEIVSAIRYHTTGKADMTLFEKLLYLADYIEATRDFSDCVTLRNYFYSASADMLHLNRTLLISYDMTLKILIEEGARIHPLTCEARNSIIKELSNT